MRGNLQASLAVTMLLVIAVENRIDEPIPGMLSVKGFHAKEHKRHKQVKTKYTRVENISPRN